MKEKINIDVEYAKQLFDGGLSMHKIAKQLGCSFTKVQKELNSYNFKLNNPYKIIDGKNLIAICKQTKKEFIDYDNRAGSITTHLIELYPNIEIPSHYKRKDILYKTYKYWYDEFFNFEYRDIKETKKCNYCDWETEDIDNVSGAYMNHMINEHNINIDEHLKKYPEDKIYFKNYIRDKERENFLNKEDNHVECKICGQKLKKITQTHLNKHNVKLSDYRNKYHKTYSNTHKKYMVNFYEKFLKNNGFTKISKWENEINDFINNLGIETIQSYRISELNYTEIDIFIPKYNIGIECNGLYYHSEIIGKKDRNYHKNKTLLSEKNNISLIHIFEDEWKDKTDIIKSKLLNLFKLNENKIHARKCIIREINPSIKNLFLNQNHIQGEDRSKISLGAYYNDDLVSVMTFDNNRKFNMEKDHTKDVYELKRFSTIKNFNIVGIGSKMFNYFLINYKSKRIISFLDYNWNIINNQNLYNILGFKKENILKPDYKYLNFKINRCKRLHKFNFGKGSLKKKFPEIYSDDKTEWEIMQEAGYDRIWDCGKIKYVYECSTSI